MLREVRNVSVIFEVNNLKKKFGGLVATNDISFKLKEKEILGVIGPNGAGKSTLFNLLAGAFPADSGKITFENKDITKSRDFERSKLGIARTYQIPKPFKKLTVLDNLLVAAYNHTIHEKEALDISNKILKNLKLYDKKDYFASELSLPEQKKLEVARALALRPKILLLDEVLAGLTPTEVNEMVATIKMIAEEESLSIIIIEHVLSAVMELSDRVIVISQGQIIEEGTPEDVVNSPTVIEVYLGEGFSFARN